MQGHRALALVFTAVLCVTPVRTAGAQSAAPPAGGQTVRDPGGRFSITVPAGWEVETNASGSPSMIAAAPSAPGEFRININVVVQALKAPLSPEALAQAAEAGLRVLFHEFTVVQQGPAQIGGRPAFYRYYTWRTNTGVSVYQVQVYFTAARTGFAITGSTLNDPARLRTDLPLIAQIIDSFRVNETAGTP